MRIKNIACCLILLLVFAIYTYGQSDDAVSIALIADTESGLENSSLVSLLEVELSQKKDIQLLERAAIDKILEEQKLSAAGLLDRNMTIKIGKLLRADAFIILSLENPVTEQSRVNQVQDANDLIRVRVSETAHGLRLLDSFEQSNNKNPQKAVEGIIQKIESVLNKISQPDEKLIPVGIVDIHRVQLGEQYKMLERTLPAMLSVRLSLEPQLIMLERENLKVLLDEKLMTEGEDTEFWSSAILIDGYIQPNNGQLELHLNLKQASGDNLDSIVVPVEPNKAVASIDKASTDIMKKLQNSPTTIKWNPEQEAEEFYKQGKMFFAHNRVQDAMPLFEIAYTLQTKNLYYIEALFVDEWTSRKNNWKPYYTDIELAEIVSNFVRLIQYEFEIGFISANNIIKSQWPQHLGEGSDSTTTAYFFNSVSVCTDEIRMLNRKSRKTWIDTMDKALKQEQSRQRFDPQMSLQRQRAELAWLSTDDPNELINNIKKSFAELIMPKESGGIVQSDSTRDSLCRALFNVRGGPPNSMAKIYTKLLENTHIKGSSEIFRKLWMEYLEELSEIDDPIISEIAKEALIKVANDGKSSLQGVTTSDAFNKAQILIKDFRENANNQSFQTKQILINQIMSYIHAGNIFFHEKVNSLNEICNFLIKQNDIESIVSLDMNIKSRDPLNSQDSVDLQESYHQYYLLLERVIEVIQTHKNDKNVMTTLMKLKDYKANIKIPSPQLNTPTKTSNMSVTMILTQNDWLRKIYFKLYDGINTATCIDKMLWIVFKENRNNYNMVPVTLAGIDLQNKKTVSLWQTEVPCTMSVPKLDGLVINQYISYLAIEGVGIIEFPGAQTNGYKYLNEPIIHSIDNGLPSRLITTIVEDGNRLWVAYGNKNNESGLGLYYPNTGKWENVFCSTIKDNNLFSEGQPYQIRSMIYIQPDILFFSVSGIKQSGLWKMDTNTRQLKHIWSRGTDIDSDTKNYIWLNTSNYKMRFDLNSENITILIRPGRQQFYEYVRRDIAGLSENLFLPESFLDNIKFGPFYSPGNLDLSTGTIQDNKLWVRMGQSQIVSTEKGNSLVNAQIIDNDLLDGKPVLKFVSTPYGLVGIGEGIVGLIETGD